MEQSYRVLLARERTRHLVAALVAAWLSFGMVGLALFLTAHRASGSYGIAGVVVAGFSAGSGLLAPLRGRLLDRRGTHPWLLVLALGYASALLAFAAVAVTRSSDWLLIFCAAVAGTSAPPLVASLRALWSRLVEESLLRRAYALTSVVGDVGLVAAPALAGLLFVVALWLPLVLCAVCAPAAALVARRAEPAVSLARRHGQTPSVPLLTAPFRLLLAVEVVLGAALGLVDIAVPAAATRWGDAAYAGFLLGAFAFGSVAGGLWFGRRVWKASPERRYLAATLLLGVALALPIAATSSALLALLLVVSGFAYGPATVSLFEALDSLAPSRATEALTWVTTAGALGTAAGSAASGWVTESVGLWAPFAAASVTLGIAAAIGLLRRLRTAGPGRHVEPSSGRLP